MANDPIPSRLHVGIFGPGDSGKTFLAQYVSLDLWQRGGIKSIVLDPNREKGWGNHCFITDSETEFERVFWAEQKCAVFIEEATETIARDKKKSGFFTRGRHRGHKIFVIGHDGMNLLRVQRQQLHTVFLFKQLRDCGEVWANQFADKSIIEPEKNERGEMVARCENLKRFEFLECRNWAKAEKRILKLPGR